MGKKLEKSQVYLGHPGGDDVAGVVVPLERAAPAHLLRGQGIPRGGERPGAVGGGGVGGAGGIGGAGGLGARHGASVGAGRRPAPALRSCPGRCRRTCRRSSSPGRG